MMQIFKGLIDRMNRRPGAGVVKVQTTDDGFFASRGDGRAEGVRWSEVERFFPYKVVCPAYEMFWLALGGGGQGGPLHTPEGGGGFKVLTSAMRKAFPGKNPEWFFDVMQPP